MKQIKDLLSKFSRLLSGAEAKKEAVQNAIFNKTGIAIESGSIEIKGAVAYLSARPVHKNEIFLKKEPILEEIQKILGQNAPKDIR